MKQLDKEPDIEAINLDAIDTTTQWRVELEEPEMEEAPEWLEPEEGEDHADDLGDETTVEGEGGEQQEDDPVSTDFQEEIDLPVQPMPPPPPPQRPVVGVGVGRRQPTLSSASAGVVGGAGSSTPSSSRAPPRPPTASRGRVVPFTRKRGRGNR